MQIETEAENDLIVGAIQAKQSYWLGANNIFGTKTFQWLDGKEMNFSNWWGNHPDKSASQQNGLAIYNKRWYDDPVTCLFFVICEGKIDFTLQSNLTGNAHELDESIKYLALHNQEWLNGNHSYLDKDYLLIKQLNTFDEAVEQCSKRGARLVEIKSEGEQEYVFDIIVAELGHSIWLGATNSEGTNQFVWIGDGSNISYSNWVFSRTPEDLNQQNYIRMSHFNGMWFHNPSLSYPNYVVCERINVFALKSNLMGERNELTANVTELDEQLQAVVLNVTEKLKTQNDGLLELITANEFLLTTQRNKIHSLEQLVVNLTQQCEQNVLTNSLICQAHSARFNAMESTLKAYQTTAADIEGRLEKQLYESKTKTLALQDKINGTNSNVIQLDEQLQAVIPNVTEQLKEQLLSNHVLLETQNDRLLELSTANEQLATTQQNRINSVEKSFADLKQNIKQNSLALNGISFTNPARYEFIHKAITTIKENQITEATIGARLQKQLDEINTKMGLKKNNKRAGRLSNGPKNITRLSN